jgi:hypothetical protein
MKKLFVSIAVALLVAMGTVATSIAIDSGSGPAQARDKP